MVTADKLNNLEAPSGVFYINVETNTYTPDKTYQETLGAFYAGRVVVMHLYSDGEFSEFLNLCRGGTDNNGQFLYFNNMDRQVCFYEDGTLD
ncbi:MAG: hypothetical protein IJU30_05475 [Lachnospiraceae bacterium]|nr:hypothetical protein [Lachnospiraceae bacterium]